MSYRLLDTTRAYALDIQIGDAEALDLAVRHAAYYRDWLEQRGRDWAIVLEGAGADIAFRKHEQCAGGARLVLRRRRQMPGSAFSSPQPLSKSFWRCPCCPSVIAGPSALLIALDADAVGSSDEMRLQAGLGVSSSQMYGESDAVNDALNRSLSIAEARGDTAYEAGLLNMQYIFHGRSGHFRILLEYARALPRPRRAIR